MPPRDLSTTPVLDPMTDITRRRLLSSLPALGLLAAGVSCGNGDNDGGATGGAVIEHKYGTTRVPPSPKRVVTLGYIDHDPVLALGVVPVGLAADEYSEGQPYGVWPWAQQALGDGKPETLAPFEFDFEKIVSLKPDVILAVYSGLTQEEYDRLAKIAPTVAQSGEYDDYQTPWDEMTRTVGKALGKSAEAERLIAGIEEKFANARDAHPQFKGKTAAYAGILEAGGYYAEGVTSTRVGILTSLGFVIPEELQGESFFVKVSEEQVKLLDRDVLLWELGAPGARQKIESNPVYKQLNAVRQGRDIFIEDATLAGGLALISVLSLPYVIDQLVPKLAAAVDGDPATKA